MGPLAQSAASNATDDDRRTIASIAHPRAVAVDRDPTNVTISHESRLVFRIVFEQPLSDE